MILLVDAPAVLWWVGDDPQLGSAARSAIADPANDVLVSAATIWEIEIKRAAGRLRIDEDLVNALDEDRFSILPITGHDAVAAAWLERHHADPFDRMVIAQAQRVGATIVSRDREFGRYDVNVLAA